MKRGGKARHRLYSLYYFLILIQMVDEFISDEDKALFSEHMRLVKPLNEKKPRVKEERPKPRIPPKRKHTEEPPQIVPYYLSDIIQETVLSHTILSYAQPGLLSQRFKALKNGQIPWQARLDLHGLKSDKARDALCHFIDAQKELGKRCVLIIHGKGGYEGEAPIIKNLVNRWLPQLENVLAFHSALLKDGRSGAVYVLLKRQKNL